MHMSHPLLGSLNDKSIEELTDTIYDLNKKLSFLTRTNNQTMINQLLMVLQAYNTEYKKRQAELWNKKSSSLNDKIDIT